MAAFRCSVLMVNEDPCARGWRIDAQSARAKGCTLTMEIVENKALILRTRNP